MKLNDYYSQCQPGASGPTTNPPPPVTTTTTGPSQPAATGLDKAFKAKGKVFFGTASDSNRFNNPTDSAVTIREFGGVTPENSMKWDAVSTFVVLRVTTGGLTLFRAGRLNVSKMSANPACPRSGRMCRVAVDVGTDRACSCCV